MLSFQSGRIPDFLILGTQKAGTTWLLRKLRAHPDVHMPSRQLHFFDREFHRGTGWYCAQFVGAERHQIIGEKTTEYFDTATIATVAPRLAETCADGRFIVILRNPVERAWSALIHHVNAGRVALPHDPQKAVFDDTPLAANSSQYFRFIERGFYARQLQTLFSFIDPVRVLVLVFEEDIVAHPDTGWGKVCAFFDLPETDLANATQPENHVRLSSLTCRSMFWVRSIPFARGGLRRIDRLLGLKPWAPEMTAETRARLHEIFEAPNHELFALLGRNIPSWND